MRPSKLKVVVWPFPPFPAVPWTPKQCRDYAKQQREQQEDAPL
jgi:hypothetical protein